MGIVRVYTSFYIFQVNNAMHAKSLDELYNLLDALPSELLIMVVDYLEPCDLLTMYKHLADFNALLSRSRRWQALLGDQIESDNPIEAIQKKIEDTTQTPCIT